MNVFIDYNDFSEWNNRTSQRDILPKDIKSRLLAAGAVTTTALDSSLYSSTNTALKLVYRDASGNFAAGTITANLTGNVTGAITGNVTGSSTLNVLKAGDTMSGNLTFSAGNVVGSASLNALKTGDTMTGDLTFSTGKNIRVSEAANSRMGTAIMVAGTILVNNTSITTTTRIFLSVQVPGGTQGFLSCSRVAATSFTINSTNVADTSAVAYLLIEPS